MTATGYRLAASSFDKTTVDLGNRRVTETNVTDVVSASNTATNDAFSEKLKLAVVSTSGATAGSMPASIAAGSSSNVTVGLASITAGSNSGTVTLSRTSDGTGTSGLADLSLGSNQVITVNAVGYRVAAASFDKTTVDLGNRRVTETNVTDVVSASNSATNDAFSEKLKLAVVSTSGATAGSMPASIAAGSSSNVTVGLASITAGSNSGTVTLSKASDGTGTSGLADLSQGNQVITVNAVGYRLAASSFDKTTVDLGNRRVTETNVTDVVSASNSATNDAFSEKLKLAVVSTSGATAGSMPASIAAGSSSNVTVGLATITAGSNSGTVTLSRTSDGTGTSGLTDLSLGSDQVITVTATGYRLAASSFDKTTVDLGNRRVTETNVTDVVSASNTATNDAYSEKLKLAVVSTSGATAGSMPASIAAGSSSNVTVGLASITAGSNSGTVTLSRTSDGTGTSGLTDLSLGSNQVITVNAVGYRVAAAAFDKTTVDLGNRRVTETNVTDVVSASNTATNDAYSEKLKLAVASTSGATAGSMPASIAAGSSSDITVGLATITAGSNSGTVTLSKASDGTGTSGLTDLSQGDQVITVNATGYRLAASSFDKTTVALGNRRVTETNVTDVVSVSNTATNDAYSEKLKLGNAGTTGSATVGTLPSSIAAGSSANVTVGLSSITAGANSATVNLSRTSDGAGTSGLTDLSLGSNQAITVTATGYRAAAASFDKTTVSLGNHRITATNLTDTVSVSNTATNDAYSEKLKLGNAGTTGSATVGTLPASISAGSSSNVTVGLSSITAGANSATVTLSKASDGTGTSGLADLSQGNQAITVTATGYRAAAASFAATTIDLGRIRITNTQSDASGTINVSNTAIADAYSEKLKLVVSSSDGATVTLPSLINAGSSTNVAFSLSEVTLGDTNTHHIVLGLVSDGTGTSGLSDLDIGSQQITVTATGVRAANASFNKTSVNLGNVRVTDTDVTGVVRVTNAIPVHTESEILKISNAGTTGAATVSLPSSVSGGGNANVTVGLSTIAVGANSGTVTLGLASDGSASGFSDLDLGTKDIAVTATGYRAAAASFDKTTIDLGRVHVNATNVTGTTTISNTVTADGYSEKLKVANGGTTGSATVGTLPGLISAAGNSGLSLGLSSISAGSNTATVTLSLASDGTGTSGLSDLSLGSQEVTILATGYTGRASWNKSTGGVWQSFDNWDGTGGKPGVDGALSTNDTATFGAGLSESDTISLDGATPVLTAMTFDNANARYTIARGTGGSITLGTAQHAATVSNVAGSHKVTAGVTLARDTEFATAAGTSLEVAGAIDGSSALNKTGSGTLNLTGGGNLSGATTVSGGLLKVNSDLSGSTVTVASGGSLGGSGTVGSTVIEAGATLTPGNSPGTLNISGDLAWTAGGNYNWQLVDATGTAGSGWDYIDISGSLDLTGLSSTNRFNINLWTLSSTGPDVNGDANNFNSALSYTWSIVKVGSVIGTFNAAYFNIQKTAVNGTGGFANEVGGGSFYVEMVDNKLNLVYAPIPEPSTYGLMIGAAALAIAALRRRRRA